MTEARTFKVKSSLARKLQDPGGRLVRDADRMAREGLEAHRGTIMETIDATLAELERLAAETPDDAGPRVYALASAVIDLGGYFDTGPLHDAAYSLCDISDRMLAAEAWRWPPILVHVQALRLIFTDGCRHDRMSEMLLDGLNAVRRKSEAP